MVALYVTLMEIQSKQPPNIIFILGDDIGYDDLGFQSGTIATPTIDNLRAKGQFIEYHYAQCVCSPTRASLLTGLYPLHHGINTVLIPENTYGLSLNFTLLPQILQKYKNYQTHFVGKWHLGMYFFIFFCKTVIYTIYFIIYF